MLWFGWRVLLHPTPSIPFKNILCYGSAILIAYHFFA